MVDTGQNVVKPSSVQIYLLYARVIKSIILILWKIKNLHTFLQHKRDVYMIFISKVFFFFQKCAVLQYTLIH